MFAGLGTRRSARDIVERSWQEGAMVWESAFPQPLLVFSLYRSGAILLTLFPAQISSAPCQRVSSLSSSQQPSLNGKLLFLLDFPFTTNFVPLRNSRYDHLYSAYLPLRASLASYSASFSPSTPSETVESQLSTLVEPLQLVLYRQHRLNLAWRVGWACWTARLLILLTNFAFVAPQYFRHLSKELRTLSTLSQAGSNSSSSTSFRTKRRRANPELRLRRAFNDMIFGSAGISSGASASFSFSFLCSYIVREREY
jgi:hypothetical protein